MAPFGPDYVIPAIQFGSGDISQHVHFFFCATCIRKSVNVSVGTLSGAVNPLSQTRPLTAFQMLKAEKMCHRSDLLAPCVSHFSTSVKVLEETQVETTMIVR